MLTCKEASLLMSRARDRRLTWRERVGVRLHLWICEQCRRFETQLNWFGGLAARFEADAGMAAGEELELSAGARERIRAAIDAHRGHETHRHPHQTGS
jgi:hypothetical protein